MEELDRAMPVKTNRNCGRVTDRQEKAGGGTMDQRVGTGLDAVSAGASGLSGEQLIWPWISHYHADGDGRRRSPVANGRNTVPTCHHNLETGMEDNGQSCRPPNQFGLGKNRDSVQEVLREKIETMLKAGMLTAEILGQSLMEVLGCRSHRPPTMMTDRSLSIEEAAERLGLSKRKFDEWRKENPNHLHHRLDRRVFYTREDIEAIEQQWQKGIRSI